MLIFTDNMLKSLVRAGDRECVRKRQIGETCIDLCKKPFSLCLHIHNTEYIFSTFRSLSVFLHFRPEHD